jgi:hypothetical protein
MARSYVSPPIDLGPQAAGREFRRADIEFEGVDHRGASFEARVFLNHPDADESTPKTPEQGYAGSFHVYGFGLPPEELRERDRAVAAGKRQGGAREGGDAASGPAAAAPPLGGEVKVPAARPGDAGLQAVARTPARRYVIATEAVRRAAAQGAAVTVTVVPVMTDPRPPGKQDRSDEPDEPLRIDRTAIVFYNQ